MQRPFERDQVVIGLRRFWRRRAQGHHGTQIIAASESGRHHDAWPPLDHLGHAKPGIVTDQDGPRFRVELERHELDALAVPVDQELCLAEEFEVVDHQSQKSDR